MLVRVSIGTLAKLKLVDIKVFEELSTAYLLQYSETGCFAKCKFCLQSQASPKASREWLGRVNWPVISVDRLKSAWRTLFKRACLQTVIKPNFHKEAIRVLRELREIDPLTSFSLAITPVSSDTLKEARELGVDTLGVGLDTANPELFEKWGKPHSWTTYWRFIEEGVNVYGAGNVYVHLIAGLGESNRDIVKTMKKAYRAGCRVALFAYTDPRGNTRVDIKRYRLIQLARFLLENGLDPDLYIDYDNEVVKKDIPISNVLDAFYTSGCPNCDRLYYNESPRGPLFNIPSPYTLREYIDRLREELRYIGVET